MPTSRSRARFLPTPISSGKSHPRRGGDGRVRRGVGQTPLSVFGSALRRQKAVRALVEDNSIRSKATSLVNLTAGYKLTGLVRVALDVFNLFNLSASDIDYFYTSRLPGRAGREG